MNMNSHRFRERGTITNYEMAPLRAEPPPRRTRWMFMWGSLSDGAHPRALEERRKKTMEGPDEA